MTKRILIVDDEESVIFAMRTYFSRRGFEVDCATDALAAMTLVEINTYCLAILDLRLGDSDCMAGIDVASSIKWHSGTTPIIMLTAHGTDEVELRAREAGVDSFLRKPKRLPELAQVAYGLLGANLDT